MGSITLNLPNKFRPSNFSEVIGQEHVTDILQSHITNNNIPASIILYGPPGTGKTTIARIFAKILNPSDYGKIELDSAEDGGKDKIQSLISSISNFPLKGDYKTYIFDESQEITRQAFSSLLKVTEEPPKHVKFIFLTTDFEKIPASIVSRSECHCLVRLNSADIKSQLIRICEEEGKNINEDILNLIVHSSLGSLRTALIKLEEVFNISDSDLDLVEKSLGIVSSKHLTKLVITYLLRDFNKLFSTMEVFKKDKIDVTKVVYDLEQLVMDIRLYLVKEDVLPFLRSDLSSFINWFVEYSSSTQIDRKLFGRALDKIYDLTVEFELDLKRTSNKDALITRYFVKLVQSLSIQ